MGVGLNKVCIWLIKINTYVIYFLLICKLLSPDIRESSNSSAPLLFLQMNVLLATSRGYHLRDLTPKEVPLTARVISGGSLKKPNSIAKSSPSIASPRFSTTPTHVYIMAYGRHTRHHRKTPRTTQLHWMHLQQHSTKHYSKHQKRHAGNCKHHHQSRGKTNIRHNSTH